MSRYLTPSKIVLLALIKVYTDGVVPSSATIAILSFLSSNILPLLARSSAQDCGSSGGSSISIEQLQSATIPHPSAIPGRTVWDLALKQLWSINSLDTLHTFFDGLGSLLEKSSGESHTSNDDLTPTKPRSMQLSRSSPFGTFIRRSQLEFTKHQLHDAIKLWKNLISYRAPTLAFWKRRNPAADIYSFDSNLNRASFGGNGDLTGIVYSGLVGEKFKDANDSTQDMEALCEYQIARMERTGSRVPQTLQAQLRAMAQPGMTVPNASYYMQYV
ncbi:MAG: hypothetical protein L6R37_002740 [Teloschistes peruensis]|nr:MAG: hypothetical protein L6R37_002740 [Teloschistes peruensis]